MSKPFVSVLMPVYNEQRFISEALDSVLNQTYQNFELVVIDDGSTDGTPEILNQYTKLDSRINVYPQPNSGIVSALNKGVDLSRGEYVARMDADDICRPERLQMQVEFLLKEGLQVVGGAVNRFSEKKNKPKNYPCNNAVIKSSILTWGDSFAHPAVLVDRLLLQKYKYNELFNGVEDMHLWMRMALDPNVKMGNVPSIVLDYRRHSEQLTKKKGKDWYIKKRTLAMYQVLKSVGMKLSQNEVDCVYHTLQKSGSLTGEAAEVMLVYMKNLERLACIDKETKKSLKRAIIMNVYRKVKGTGVVGLWRMMLLSVGSCKSERLV